MSRNDKALTLCVSCALVLSVTVFLLRRTRGARIRGDEQGHTSIDLSPSIFAASLDITTTFLFGTGVGAL